MSPQRTKAIQFIDSASTLLGESIDILAKSLAIYLINFFQAKLTIKDGDIQNISANYDVVNNIGESQKGFFTEAMIPFLAKMAEDFFEIEKLNESYFSTMDSPDLSNLTIDKVSAKVFDNMHKAFGFKVSESAVEIAPDGWLMNIGDISNVYQRIREEAIRAVSQKMPWQEFHDRLMISIEGDKNISGLVKAHFRTIVWDVYAEYDRQVGFNYAVGLGFRAARYEGGLIDHSRDFCIERDGKIFTFDEIKLFGTPEDKYGGYSDKPTGKFDGKPSVGYDPFFNQGGYQCRHAYSYIPDRAAIRERPELKDELTKPASA